MDGPWLTIIGIGEDGLAGLSDASRDALSGAALIFGGPRHLALAEVGERGREWPVPFDIAPVLAQRGRAVAVLASGDPFWFGAGGSLTAQLAPGEWRALPGSGTFSLAAARLGWRLEETICLGLHAAPFARLRPHLTRGCRIVATLRDGASPAELARWLSAQAAGAVEMIVLERLEGPSERVRHGQADALHDLTAQAPVAVALNGDALPRGAGISAMAGRPDADFFHDGQITRAPIRAITLAALAPRRDELLWDIGGGSGSVSVEWALAGGRAITIEPRADRRQNIVANIDGFGLQSRIELRAGQAPEALEGLPPADAVFVGGGGSEALFAHLWQILPEGARLVANSVTLETETLLTALHSRRGGQLFRFDMAEALPLGGLRGWQPQRPVVQWRVQR